MGQYFTLTVIMHGSAMSSKPGRMKDDALYLRLKETSFPIFHSILTKKGKKEGRKATQMTFVTSEIWRSLHSVGR